VFDVAIGNLTLQKIGADDQIADPDENSACARALRASWDLVRRITLRELTPSCAIGRLSIPRRVSGPEPIGFDSAFPMPANNLRLLEVLSPLSVRDSYKLEGGEVLADTDGPVAIRFVRDLVDTSLWDPLFVQSFADRLGMQIADRVTCSLERVARCAADYKAAKQAAGGADAKENPPVETDESSWITSRFGGCG
jgi:hypothetical protein